MVSASDPPDLDDNSGRGGSPVVSTLHGMTTIKFNPDLRGIAIWTYELRVEDQPQVRPEADWTSPSVAIDGWSNDRVLVPIRRVLNVEDTVFEVRATAGGVSRPIEPVGRLRLMQSAELVERHWQPRTVDPSDYLVVELPKADLVKGIRVELELSLNVHPNFVSTVFDPNTSQSFLRSCLNRLRAIRNVLPVVPIQIPLDPPVDPAFVHVRLPPGFFARPVRLQSRFAPAGPERSPRDPQGPNPAADEGYGAALLIGQLHGYWRSLGRRGAPLTRRSRRDARRRARRLDQLAESEGAPEARVADALHISSEPIDLDVVSTLNLATGTVDTPNLHGTLAVRAMTVAVTDLDQPDQRRTPALLILLGLLLGALGLRLLRSSGLDEWIQPPMREATAAAIREPLVAFLLLFPGLLLGGSILARPRQALPRLIWKRFHRMMAFGLGLPIVPVVYLIGEYDLFAASWFVGVCGALALALGALGFVATTELLLRRWRATEIGR